MGKFEIKYTADPKNHKVTLELDYTNFMDLVIMTANAAKFQSLAGNSGNAGYCWSLFDAMYEINAAIKPLMIPMNE